MKKKKMATPAVAPFVPPTDFELTLRNKDKAALEKVVTWLMARGVHSFSWSQEWDNDLGAEVYTLCVETTWADNLAQIARRLGDYNEDGWDGENDL